MEPNVKLRITLTTADDCVGTLDIDCDDGHEKPMSWDREPESETESATFERLDDGGKVVDTVEITGDEWRDLESNGEEAYLWFWLRRGVSLEATVAACVLGVDPDGYDHEYEQTVDDKNAEIARLREALQLLYVSACDSRRGYTDRDLHEPWPETKRRAFDALVATEPSLSTELEQP
jgi:hypothetical protein